MVRWCCCHDLLLVADLLWPPTEMTEIHGELVPMALYNVKYLLGGSEKDVRETYIRCTKADGEQEARKIVPRDYFVPNDSKVQYLTQQSTSSWQLRTAEYHILSPVRWIPPSLIPEQHHPVMKLVATFIVTQ